MRKFLTMILLLGCFTLLSSNKNREDKYETIVRDMPSTRIILEQNKQMDSIRKQLIKYSSELDSINYIHSK